MAGLRLPRPPADLRAPHTGQHTAGDIFWWITHGIPRGQMPAFGTRLSEEDRWDLVNFVRTLGAVEAARSLGEAIPPARPSFVAPDFTFAVGPTPPRALKDYRGRRVVLLVLYTLPGSRPRLAQLAQNYESLALMGLEIIAVPRDGDPHAIQRLGDEPRVFFPVVTQGASDIVAVYGLFSPAPHSEFLIDRQGYLRARWVTGAELLPKLLQLNEEKTVAPPPEDHVH